MSGQDWWGQQGASSQPPPAYPPPAGPAYGPAPGQDPSGQYGYGQPYGYAPPVTEGKATTSLILAIVGLFVCGLLLEPAAIAFGFSARRSIRRSGGRLTGEGQALAGIIIGFIALALNIVVFIVVMSLSTRTRTRF